MNDIIMKTPYNERIGNVMFDSKVEFLQKVADKYNIAYDELTKVLNKVLLESNMKVGGCNTAVDFLITETLDKNKMYDNVVKAIKSNILSSGIYYVNVINKSEFI